MPSIILLAKLAYTQHKSTTQTSSSYDLNKILFTTSVIQKPKLYFLGGAGGSWLNYVTWCALNQTTHDYDYVNFHTDLLKKIIPKYTTFYQMVPHETPREFANIRLGSNRALINFYINVRAKNPTWTGGNIEGYMKTRNNQVFSYNLDYTDIFLDPESFLAQLKNLSGYDICFDQHTKKAIEQYKRSCSWTNLTFDELSATPIVQEAWTYCRNNMTDINLPESARNEEAWYIVRQYLLVMK